MIDFGAALRRLAELGPPSEIRRQAPTLAAETLGFDRVVLSCVRDGMLFAEALHLAPRAGNPARVLEAVRRTPVSLEYPLVEGEIMRRRRPQVVRLSANGSTASRAFEDVLRWADYAAAPVLLEGRVTGFLHADRQVSSGGIDDEDAEALGLFATCFAIVYERAVLRHRLRVQRDEMRQVASWADARTSELGDRSITLDDGPVDSEQVAAVGTAARGADALRDLLTRREVEVLELMVRGETNAGIARNLVVSVGTVKFHVKNILRKLHASNRADATSRYMRLTLNRR